MKPILDMCCGGRMFWFDKANPLVVFQDKRREFFQFKNSGQKSGFQSYRVEPDVLGDFTEMAFADESFHLVVFDPPHLLASKGTGGWLRQKYGTLNDWQETLRKGFSEAFRVLKPNGTLIFKWASTEIPVSEIVRLSPIPPLFGNVSGKKSHVHWIVFIKV